MRISNITDKFANLENRSGASMRSEWDYQTQTMRLYYTYGAKSPIAEIFDYKDSKNFRLRLFQRNTHTGRTEHNNRLNAVLVSIQKLNGGDWERVRYSSHIHYNQKVYDRKLSIQYTLDDYHNREPIEFVFSNSRLTIDYALLERKAYPQEEVAKAAIKENSNLETINTRLTTLIQGV